MLHNQKHERVACSHVLFRTAFRNITVIFVLLLSYPVAIAALPSAHRENFRDGWATWVGFCFAETDNAAVFSVPR